MINDMINLFLTDKLILFPPHKSNVVCFFCQRAQYLNRE